MADCKTVGIYADFSSLTEDDLAFMKTAVIPHLKEANTKLRKDSVCARVLLKHLLKSVYGVTDFVIDVEEKGKPFIVGSELHFNLSHGDKYVFCAVSDKEVGCDVQNVRSFNEKVSNRFYTSEENTLLHMSGKKQEHFIKLWTLKESILKQKGSGISGGLSSYGFSEFICCDDFAAYGLYFKSFYKNGSYFGICSKTADITVFEADIKDAIKNLM